MVILRIIKPVLLENVLVPVVPYFSYRASHNFSTRITVL
jgi:hypothetical protein